MKQIDNQLTTKFQVEELEQRLEMGKWSLSAEASYSESAGFGAQANATFTF